MRKENQPLKPANAELIATMIELGNLGESVRIVGKTREERLAKFREVYYGFSAFKKRIS